MISNFTSKFLKLIHQNFITKFSWITKQEFLIKFHIPRISYKKCLFYDIITFVINFLQTPFNLFFCQPVQQNLYKKPKLSYLKTKLIKWVNFILFWNHSRLRRVPSLKKFVYRNLSRVLFMKSGFCVRITRKWRQFIASSSHIRSFLIRFLGTFELKYSFMSFFLLAFFCVWLHLVIVYIGKAIYLNVYLSKS